MNYLQTQQYRLSERKLPDEEFDRIFSLLVLPDGELRYPELKIETVQALLSPFVISNMKLSVEQRERLRTFAIHCFGDPKYSKEWNQLPDEVNTVMARWQSSIPMYHKHNASDPWID